MVDGILFVPNYFRQSANLRIIDGVLFQWNKSKIE